MLINPFDISVYSEKKEVGIDIREIIDKITINLVGSNSKLITEVEAGKASKRLLEAEIIKLINEIEEAKNFPREALINSVFNSIFGFGDLEPYLKDPEISDILINTPHVVYVKKLGKKFRVPVDFGDTKNLLNYCRKITAICGGRLNENEAEVVLTDRKRNLRIVISIEPVNVGSPAVVIRKPTTFFDLDKLVNKGMLNNDIAEYLRKSVKTRETIVVAGKGGAGKTTLLGALINEVPHSERGLLIQETNEITPNHPDVISQLVKISDIPEIKSYTLFDLTKFGLLMSMDRMFIGEMKDREAFDFFNAVFTGHRGSMATVHSNSAEETIDRLVLLMKRADTNLPGEYLMELLSESLDIIVFLENYKIKEISRVVGFNKEKMKVIYDKIFVY